MAERIIDTFITVFGFRSDKAQLAEVQKNIRGIRNTLDGLARGFTIAGAAMSAALFGAGKTILEFEAAQNRLAAVFLEDTPEQLARLREQSRLLGGTTSKTATDAATAQLELARAGFSLNEVLTATPDVLNLAIAGELSMGEAALLVSRQINSFNLEIDQTARVTDVLAYTASNSATTVQELGPAFRQVAPFAAALGLNIEEVAGAFALLRNNGRRAEQAGTDLRNLLGRLADTAPPDDFIQGLQQLGVDFRELQAMIQSGQFTDAMRTLADAGLTAGDATRLFGLESTVAATILAKGADEVDAFTESLYSATGASDQMREKMEQGLPGAVAEFRSALEGVILGLGDDGGLTGKLEGAINKISEFLRWLSQSNAFLRWTATTLLVGVPLFLGLGFALKTVSFALSGYTFFLKVLPWLHARWNASLLGTRIGLLMLSVRTWAASAAQIVYRGVMLAGTAITWLATAATLGFNAALLANPITWVVIGIVALIAAIVMLIIHWDKVSAAIVYAWDIVKSAMMTAWNWVKENWPLLLAILGGPFILVPYLVFRFRDTIIDALKWLWNWITGWVDKVSDKVMGVINKIAFWRGDDGEEEPEDEAAPIQALPPTPSRRTSPNNLAPLPEFAEGGVVPGQKGRPVLSKLHAGEIVLPVRIADALRELTGAPQNELPAAPAPGVAQPEVDDRLADALRRLGGLRLPAPPAPGVAQPEVDDRLADALRRLGGLRLPAAPAPMVSQLPAPPIPIPPAAGATTVNATITLDSISISVERGDPDEIAAQVGASLQQQLQDAAENFASRIVR